MTTKAEDPRRRAQRHDATGQLVERHGKRGTTWGVRFRLPDGRRSFTTVGRSWEDCDRREAERRADVVLAQARLVQWRTPEERERERQEREAARRHIPLFAPFAQTWLAERIALGAATGPACPRLVPKTSSGALGTWRRGSAGWRSTRSTRRRSRRTPLQSAPPRSCRRSQRVVDQQDARRAEAILRRGFRHGIIDRNPVDGYRVPGGSGVRRTYVDHAEGLDALLDAAGAWTGNVRPAARRGAGRSRRRLRLETRGSQKRWHHMERPGPRARSAANPPNENGRCRPLGRARAAPAHGAGDLRGGQR